MRFDKFIPTDRLRPYIKYFVVSEDDVEKEYKVFPSSGLVIGFQYKGRLARIEDHVECKLAPAGITGISDRYKVFRNETGTGTVLVFFTETGLPHFTVLPANELFDLSISLDNIFERTGIHQVEEKLSTAASDTEKIRIVEQFLLSQLKQTQADRLVIEAVRLIYQSGGAIRMKELAEKLFTSQSPLEKRFRKVVGTSPKKFASIIRFNAVLESFGKAKTLAEICHEHHFFDQAHFAKAFKQFTGETPDNFKRSL